MIFFMFKINKKISSFTSSLVTKISCNIQRKSAAIYNSDRSRIAQNLVTESSILTRFFGENHNKHCLARPYSWQGYILSKQGYFIVIHSGNRRALRIFFRRDEIQFSKERENPSCVVTASKTGLYRCVPLKTRLTSFSFAKKAISHLTNYP